MRTGSGKVASIVTAPIGPNRPVSDILAAWLQRRDGVVLEGSLAGHEFGRFSILAADPVETLLVKSGGRGGGAVEQLADRHDRLPFLEPCAAGSPFLGGWIGFFGYESGLPHEGLTTHKPGEPWLPDAQFNLYDTALVFDARTGSWIVVAVEWPPGIHSQRGPAQIRVERMRQWFAEVRSAGPGEPAFHEWDEGSGRPCQASLSKSTYLQAARRVQEYIAAGDVFQANLSVRFASQTPFHSKELYLRLRSCNPAPFSAYFPTSSATILSASPELFLDLQGRDVITRPIKGTRPRLGVSHLDTRAKDELLRDEKERAELVMIVDLLRNDLGRVCEWGSVRVDEPATLETHPTVFHRVATIAGRLRDDQNWSDLLRSTFPGGSVTGAPKIRAMQIIDELEPTPRGVYCGAMGWLGLDRSVRFNLAIRTMVHVGDQVYMYAGGAITAGSDPDREHAEILAKAAGLFRAVGSRAPNDAPRAKRAAEVFTT